MPPQFEIIVQELSPLPYVGGGGLQLYTIENGKIVVQALQPHASAYEGGVGLQFFIEYQKNKTVQTRIP
jgi:hypothetical protein